MKNYEKKTISQNYCGCEDFQLYIRGRCVDDRWEVYIEISSENIYIQQREDWGLGWGSDWWCDDLAREDRSDSNRLLKGMETFIDVSRLMMIISIMMTSSASIGVHEPITQQMLAVMKVSASVGLSFDEPITINICSLMSFRMPTKRPLRAVVSNTASLPE